VDKDLKSAAVAAAIIGGLMGVVIVADKAKGKTGGATLTGYEVCDTGSSVLVSAAQERSPQYMAATLSDCQAWAVANIPSGDNYSILGVYSDGTYQFVSHGVGTAGGGGGSNPLQIWPSIGSVLNEPDGSSIVLLGASADGGTSPYSWKITWADGFPDANATGVFQRNFVPGVVPVTSGTITVSSPDGEKASVLVSAS